MANTWQSPSTRWLPSTFNEAATDNVPSTILRTGDKLSYSAANLTLPVDIVVGGSRHGIGFLFALSQVNGLPLVRKTLIQARYAWSPEQHKLLLAPGCTPAKPQSLEASLGLVLSPTFETRCLRCHGQPNNAGSGPEGGVHCEACHGPGSAHLLAVRRGQPQQGIINPQRLSNEESIAVCAQCHVGLTRFSDPAASDLLIANQVRAIQASECYLQSRKAFSCTACHNPHDSISDAQQSLKACLGCHSLKASPHAAICPVNATSGCISCHMPSVDMGPLHLVDHLIRVHPEQIQQPQSPIPTQVTPVSEYLRLITVNSLETASQAAQRLEKGESFYDVAHDLSIDKTKVIGGYLGSKILADLGNELSTSAAHLAYGETSCVITTNGHWTILQRLPRDFRWQADQLQSQAETLAASGDPAAAIAKAQDALKIYPPFLRAITFIGVTFAQSGNPQKGMEVLTTATHLYPEDAPTQFALASILKAMGNNTAAIQAYQKVIALEPEFTAAYINLGNLEVAANDFSSAIATFRAGLQIDPLSPELNAALGLALTQSGDTVAGAHATALARSLN